MKKILIIDDEKELRDIVRDVLSDEGFHIIEAADGMEAIDTFKSTPPDAVLLDLNLPDIHGMKVMRELQKINPQVPIIILTAFGDIPTAVEAIKCGAYGFETKPPDFDKLIVSLRRAAERRHLEMEVARVNTALEVSLEHMFGKSGVMKEVINQISQVALTDLSVVIQGETGTGKSFVANAIHNLSKRNEKSFIRVDVGALPDTLIESELFGYKRGAFTGADRNKPGYLETARGGTLFIDEIENLPLHIQIKLLSVIDEKKIFPLGSTSPVDMDVRFIAATNRDIKQSVRLKTFREDLFYRMGEYMIVLPSLKDRKEDIPFFAQKFMIEACSELDRNVCSISDEALELLINHSWPGNIRELKNLIRRAVLLAGCDNLILARDHVGAAFRNQCEEPSLSSLRDAVRELEKKKIEEAMTLFNGNKKKVADLLQINYGNLRMKIKEYGISEK